MNINNNNNYEINYDYNIIFNDYYYNYDDNDYYYDCYLVYYF